MAEIEELSSSAKITWRVKNFSSLNSHLGSSSDVFSVGRFKWRVQIFPKGDGKVYDHVSVFLVSVNPTEFPYTECRFTIISQTDSRNRVTHEVKRKLTEEGGGWGFPTFMPLTELHDPAKGYIVNDTCVIRIDVSCRMNEEPVEDFHEATELMSLGSSIPR